LNAGQKLANEEMMVRMPMIEYKLAVSKSVIYAIRYDVYFPYYFISKQRL